MRSVTDPRTRCRAALRPSLFVGSGRFTGSARHVSAYTEASAWAAASEWSGDWRGVSPPCGAQYSCGMMQSVGSGAGYWDRKRGRGMTGSRRGHGSTNSDRAVAALPTGSPRRFALLALGLFAVAGAAGASLGAASASAYECYSGSPKCSAGPAAAPQHARRHLGRLLHVEDDHLLRVLAAEGGSSVPEGGQDRGHGLLQGAETENGSDQNFFSVLAQYGLHETHFGKAIKDKDPSPPKAPAAICQMEPPLTRPWSRCPRSKPRSKNLSTGASCRSR